MVQTQSAQDGAVPGLDPAAEPQGELLEEELEGRRFGREGQESEPGETYTTTASQFS